MPAPPKLMSNPDDQQPEAERPERPADADETTRPMDPDAEASIAESAQIAEIVRGGSGGDSVNKMPTGIVGFDAIAFGGVPRGRSTLVSGTAGAGKTIFAMQFLAHGIEEEDRGGVFVTFEEAPGDIRHNVESFGWDIRKWEAEGRFAFVDASPAEHAEVVVGQFDLDALMNRIIHAAEKVNANRVSLDSLSGLYGQGFGSSGRLRIELFRLIKRLKNQGLTVVLTVERERDSATISRQGIDEFVADTVVVLRNALVGERRRRTVEIVKYRGSRHREGSSPFTIHPAQGIVSLPLSSLRLTQTSTLTRISSGTPELDNMCGGGFFRDSVVLVSGPTGTGKTLLSTYFVGNPGGDGDSGPETGRALLLAYEESHEQLLRNADSFGINLRDLTKDGRLKIVCQYPETKDLQAHLLEITELVQRFKPTRIAIDSLSALERVGNEAHFREFLIGLTSLVKRHEVATLVTSTSRNLIGAKSVSEQHISTLTDSIILLRYVELEGDIDRGIMVLKMRGSAHDDQIRRFTIDSGGVHIHGGFEGISGIMSGQVRSVGGAADDNESDDDPEPMTMLSGGDG